MWKLAWKLAFNTICLIIYTCWLTGTAPPNWASNAAKLLFWSSWREFWPLLSGWTAGGRTAVCCTERSADCGWAATVGGLITNGVAGSLKVRKIKIFGPSSRASSFYIYEVADANLVDFYDWILWSVTLKLNFENNALISNKHFPTYKFTSKQREAVNWQLLFVWVSAIWKICKHREKNIYLRGIC